MTDIDAIRANGGTPRYGLQWNGPQQPVPVGMADGYWTPWHLAEAERDALLSAYDAKCEELAKANDLLTCGFVGDTPDYLCLLCGQLGTDHVQIELAQLRAERETAQSNAFAMFTQMGAVTAERDAAVREREGLRKALNDYGTHGQYCASRRGTAVIGGETEWGPCTCGYEAALAPPTEQPKVSEREVLP